MRLQRSVSHISLESHVEWLCLYLWRAVGGALPQGVHQQAKCHDEPHLPQGRGNLGNSIRCMTNNLKRITYGCREK